MIDGNNAGRGPPKLAAGGVNGWGAAESFRNSSPSSSSSGFFPGFEFEEVVGEFDKVNGGDCDVAVVEGSLLDGGRLSAATVRDK